MKVSLAYRALVAVAARLAPFLARTDAQLRGHAGRVLAPDRLEEWAASNRDPKKPLLWIHAASVGESLQAREVIAALKATRTDLQIVATRFSASAERIADSMQVDLTEYLPYDRRIDVDRVLAALKPDLLVFAKLDLWPQLACRAAECGSKVALVAGAVDPGSSRLRWPSRMLSRSGYQILDCIAANSIADGSRLELLGVNPSKITITGDPRIDSVLAGIEDQQASVAAPTVPNARTMVAGSTWPEDEEVLLKAFARVKRDHPDARLIVVPHEPSEAGTRRLETMSHGLDLDLHEWTGVTPLPEQPLILANTIGMLAHLYCHAGVTYVGGGFGKRGIHSVIEPAGWARPIIIGPNDRGLREAGRLAESGGLFRLSAKNPSEDLHGRWTRWIDNNDQLVNAGVAARATLDSDRGAAARIVALLNSHLPAIAIPGN